MAQAKAGDRVRVHYTGTLADGTLFDASPDGEPMEFTIGGREVVPGFEQAVIGLDVDESVTTTIPAGEAYGDHREDRVVTIDRDDLPLGADPKVGQSLRISLADGRSAIACVRRVTETAVSLDANHPLAGKDLTFEIRLVEIV